MNCYLTNLQEEKVYQEVMNIFESEQDECTNCESNFIFDERNYFEMYTKNDVFKVEFKTKKGKLLKRSLTIKKL